MDSTQQNRFRNATLALKAIIHGLEFDHVAFRYDADAHPQVQPYMGPRLQARQSRASHQPYWRDTDWL